MPTRATGGKLDWRLAAGLAVIAAAGALLSWRWLARREPVADTDTGRQVADAFLEQLRAGQVDAAWQSTTADFKSDEGRESFARYVREQPVLLQPLAFARYEVSDLNGLKRGQCFYVPAAGVSPAAAASQVRIAIARELGEWKVEGIFVD